MRETRHLERCRFYRTEARLEQTRSASSVSPLGNKSPPRGRVLAARRPGRGAQIVDVEATLDDPKIVLRVES